MTSLPTEEESNTPQPTHHGFCCSILPSSSCLHKSSQINPYMSNPCHIELILTEIEETVQKAEAVVGREEVRLNARQRGARLRKALTAA